MIEQYHIKGTSYLNPPEEFKSQNLYPNFQNDLLEFKDQIIKNLREKNNLTYYKFGDGDYYFLRKEPRGSAKPGRRALKRPYFLINHKKFVEGSKKNDVYMGQLPKMHKEMFHEIFNRKYDFPAEFVYGLLANKWLLTSPSKKIGIIGADKKLELIEMLLDRQEYKEYLGIEKFTDYISVPQRFACDNLNKTYRQVKTQLTNSKSDIFLIGVGHVKSGLLNELKNVKKSIYLDIGVGVDALAGVINLTRPYFGNWNNFQIKNNNIYKDIDYLVNKNNNVKNIVYLK